MRAGERNLVDAWMRGKRRTGSLAIARHHVNDAWRNTGFHHQFRQPQRGQRRFLGRFQDHRAAGSDRRAYLPDRGGERTVPGNDRADDTDRLLQRIGEDVTGQRVLDGLAMQRGGLARI
jgi:hypothetical protein